MKKYVAVSLAVAMVATPVCADPSKPVTVAATSAGGKSVNVPVGTVMGGSGGSGGGLLGATGIGTGGAIVGGFVLTTAIGAAFLLSDRDDSTNGTRSKKK